MNREENKQKSLVTKIILIIIGVLVAGGITTGVIFGIGAVNEMSKNNDYRNALNELNSIILKYNELSGLESITLDQLTDEETLKSAAANDIKKITDITDYIKSGINTLENEKVFTGDDIDVKNLFETLTNKRDSFINFYDIAVDAYKLKAEGNFAGAKDKMLSGDMKADSEFATALNELNQYLVNKANN